MLGQSNVTFEACIVGYSERVIHSEKKLKDYHIAEVYYTRKRENEEKHQYGSIAESFTYFFGKNEDVENCDICELLEDIRDGYTVLADMTGTYKNYKFNPTKIETKERV